MSCLLLSDRQIAAIVIGFGQRGSNYASYATRYPDKLRIVGTADPRSSQRQKAREAFKLKDDQLFESWEEVVKRDRIAELAIIATQDRDHKAPAIQLARKGYHILLEKPIAVT